MYLKIIKKYYGDNGRARRTEYWVLTTVCIILYYIENTVNNRTTPIYQTIKDITLESIGSLSLTIAIILIYCLLYIATAVRRCTDIGISQWYTILFLVPYARIAFAILLGLIKTDAARTPAAQAKIKKVMSLFKSK